MHKPQLVQRLMPIAEAIGIQRLPRQRLQQPYACSTGIAGEFGEQRQTATIR
ncbi:hypothetical protein D3C77_791640 [compost metagenome]